MARKGREYDDDDGRTIADMSDMSAPGLMGHPRVDKPEERAEERPQRPAWEQTTPSRKERASMIWIALGAALLIALIFLGAIALVIVLMQLLWS